MNRIAIIEMREADPACCGACGVDKGLNRVRTVQLFFSLSISVSSQWSDLYNYAIIGWYMQQ